MPSKKRQRGAERDKYTWHVVLLSLYVTKTLPTLSPLGQLSGKQDVGQLALRVGPDGVIVFLSAQVIKLDLAHGVSCRRHVDDPGWGRVLQQVQ